MRFSLSFYATLGAKAILDIILGHNLSVMDDHYIKLNKNALHDAMDNFTEWLDGQLSKAKIQLESE